MSNNQPQQLDIQSAILEEQSRMKNVVFTGLLDTPIRGKLPESIFVNYFLPHFIGRGNDQNWVVNWISVAGSPMTEVDILDDQTGESLFIVPGFLNSSHNALPQDDGSVTDIIKRAEMIGENNPMEKLSFASRALYSKQQQYLSTLNRDLVNERWYYILKRYNLITDTPASNSGTVSSAEDYFEF